MAVEIVVRIGIGQKLTAAENEALAARSKQEGTAEA